MAFPTHRARRLRENQGIRSLVRETVLTPQDFIYPLFVVHGKRVRNEIASMPGNYHLSVDELVKEAQGAYNQGIRAFLLSVLR